MNRRCWANGVFQTADQAIDRSNEGEQFPGDIPLRERVKRHLILAIHGCRQSAYRQERTTGDQQQWRPAIAVVMASMGISVRNEPSLAISSRMVEGSGHHQPATALQRLHIDTPAPVSGCRHSGIQRTTNQLPAKARPNRQLPFQDRHG